MSSWNRSYRGRTLGRVLHFIYHYCGPVVAENCQVGAGEVTYYGNKIAEFIWLSDTDIPHFKFLPNWDYSGQDKAALYMKNQETRLVEAIQDSADAKPEDCKECRNLRLRLSMMESRDGS